MKNRIIIADINSRCTQGVLTGHGLAVAENYRQLGNEDTEIVVAGGPAYAKRFPDAIVLDYDADAALPDKENKRRNLHNIRQLFRLCPHDTIVFQSSAVATSFLGIALYKPRTCRVFMIQYNTMGLDSLLKRAFYALARRRITGLICPQEGIGKAYGRPCCVVPDYIYTAAQHQAAIPYEQKRYDFCMVGLIYPDKGTVEAARLLADSPHKVLIAGKPATPEIAEALTAIAAKAPHITLRLGYLSEEEYRQSLAESRYCILNYRGGYATHSSGVIYDTLFSGVPVVGHRCEALRLVEENGVGVLEDELSAATFARVLREEQHRNFCEAIRRYYETHQAHRNRLLQFLSLPKTV